MQKKLFKTAVKNAVTTAINCQTSDGFCNVLGIANNDTIKEWWKSFCNPVIEFFNFACKSTGCDINAFSEYMSDETVEAFDAAVMETNGEDFIIQLYNDNDMAAHSVMIALNMRFISDTDLLGYKNNLIGARA